MDVELHYMTCGRFGDNDVEVAAAGGWDESSDVEHLSAYGPHVEHTSAAYGPLPPTVNMRPTLSSAV